MMWITNRDATDYVEDTGGYIAFNNFYEDYSFAQINADRVWFEELDRRMAQGIRTAKQKHARPPKQAMIAKKRPIKYSREPRLSANWLRRQEKC